MVLDDSSPRVSSNLALPIVVPFIIGVMLIVAVLLMPKGFFLDLTYKICIDHSKDEANKRFWLTWKPSKIESSTAETPQPTSVERHLEMLRT